MFRRYRPDRCYIIAEIGGNFTTFEEARRLIDAAAQSGVDAVKLQTYRAETVASRVAMFVMENTGVTSQFDLFKKYEIGAQLHREVFAYAESRNLDWFSTPSHVSDVDFLEECGVGAYKIGSDDAANLPFLRYVARLQKPVILSTGMCTLEEVHEAVDAIVGEGNRKLVILHAVTSYPTHPENVNLKAIQTLAREFSDFDVGYSDHTLTPVASLCAVAMGARMIERHFTLDRNAEGPDHRLSADPDEMRWLVDAVRSLEVMNGSGIKEPAASEMETRVNNRKSIVLERELAAGCRLTAEDLVIKRPGTGIAPKYLEDVVGRTLVRAMGADAVLQWDDLA
ncbi:N-acetylneuraminate synthase family protein [Bradyrhizobium sp. BR 10261]|uniref:N-acetylneuraminate synthase family protein n=1 Tax=Bradyrhizobium sp. BR 10261 TaxID=2749992 RepID=UPI001C652E96|nr:N-acetylneuraminate synthase family protein [Bradyrhizobium sp. BR 10261]MBW7961131.1 N-acetylneuraminate synthase family protein [Bradyrhizobium sp. BR 10261]